MLAVSTSFGPTYYFDSALSVVIGLEARRARDLRCLELDDKATTSVAIVKTPAELRASGWMALPRVRGHRTTLVSPPERPRWGQIRVLPPRRPDPRVGPDQRRTVGPFKSATASHVAECPIDEINRPRGARDAALRIPPSKAQIGELFAGWRGELAACRKFAPTARNYAASRLMAEVGLRVNEACQLDLADIKWDLGRFGKLHVRIGKGARGSGPREPMVPLINNARATLEWFVGDVWGHFDDDHTKRAKLQQIQHSA